MRFIRPEIHPEQVNVDIGAGQPEYESIPAVKVVDVEYGMHALVFGLEPDSFERVALARSAIRGAILTFALWLKESGLYGALPPEDLFSRFLSEHPVYGGEDATIWYHRLLPPGDLFQPMRAFVGTEPGIEWVPADPSPDSELN